MPATAPLRHLKECRQRKCNTGEIPHATLRKSICIFEEKVLAKNTEAEFAVQFSDFQTTGIFQCKESVHKSNICVNIRNIQSVWRYFKDLCQCV